MKLCKERKTQLKPFRSTASGQDNILHACQTHPDVFNKLIFQLKGAHRKTGGLYSVSVTDREILMLWVLKYPEHLYLNESKSDCVYNTDGRASGCESFLIRQHAAGSCFPLTDILFKSLTLSGGPCCDTLLILFSAPFSVSLKDFLWF